MTITSDLIAFALGDIIPTDRARRIAQLSAVDWASCGQAGAAEGTFEAWSDTQDAAGPVATFAGRALNPATAALVNGTLSHALDFDDTHFGHIGHPSVVIFSAVLATGPQDWRALEEAALVGIEASIRVGLWLGRDHYQRGFHQTATAGAFGACLAAARVLQLSEKQAEAAVGLCATMASGLKAQFGTMGKPLNAGLAARAGVEAALWAKGGMTGPADGIAAFGAALDAAGDDAALSGLGRTWQIETLSHKFHACCHGLHATLEALRGYEGGVPESVEVRTHPRWMTVCNQPDPQTGLSAKFSYRQVVAMALSGIDTGNIDNFNDALAQDADMARLRDRVVVTPDDSLTETQAVVTLTDADGAATLSHDLAAPVALDDLSDRIRKKASALIGADRATALWEAMTTSDLQGFVDAGLPTKKAPA